jgi:CRISPR-associated endoribonuclease Cas6
MHFKLKLTTTNTGVILPINYQYPLSAVIYRILQKADADYSAFLHNQGYTKGLKTFKFFTFSDIEAPFKISGDRLKCFSAEVSLVVSFYLPKAAENFIKGLFLHQQIEIADNHSRAVFIISQVEALATLPATVKEVGLSQIMVKPISPIVCGLKNQRGNYDYLAPTHPQYTQQLLYNWKEKFETLYEQAETEKAFLGASIEVVLNNQPPKSRLVTIKAGTPEETKIKGYNNFGLRVIGTKGTLEMLMGSGAGVYNSLGMGCLGV